MIQVSVVDSKKVSNLVIKHPVQIKTGKGFGFINSFFA